MKSILKTTIMVYSFSLVALFNLFAGESKLVAHWSFDSTSKDTYFDATGNGFDAFSPGLSVEKGVVGNALRCPGNGYKLMIANSKTAFFLPKFTIEAFFKSDSPIFNDVKIFNFQNIQTGVRNGYTLYIKKSTGSPCVSISDATGNNWMDADAKTKIEPHMWYHLVATFDGHLLKIYVNGKLEGSLNHEGNYLPPQADAQIACSRLRNGEVKNHLDGLIDEVKLYNYSLSEETILSHYNEMTLPEEKRLVAHWSFDSTSKNTYFDVTGNGFDAFSPGLSLEKGVIGNALRCPGNGYKLMVGIAPKKWTRD
jgi:hypothetical protein